MDPNKTCLERAFDLARSGACRSTSGLKARLRMEGYDDKAIFGRSLMTQLRVLIAAAKNPG
jgi:hypothetical protein